MSMILFMLSLVEHGKSVMTFGPGLEVNVVISCSTQLNMKFILLINVKMSSIIAGICQQFIVVGILTLISRLNSTPVF